MIRPVLLSFGFVLLNILMNPIHQEEKYTDFSDVILDWSVFAISGH